MKRIDTASALLLALCLFALLARLSAVPAMSLDEAWIGLFAGRLRSTGLFSAHQMNHYTGPLYGGLVAAFYGALGFSHQTLRLPGAALNAVALLGLWLHLRRRVSAEAAFTFALLTAGSAFFLMKGRLAWEVYALHPILILGTAAALARPGAWPLLLAVTVAGAQNHFIYLSIPASLVVMFGARAAWNGEQDAEGPLRDSVTALAGGVVLALVKNPITEESWLAHRGAWLAALAVLPLLAAAAIRFAPARLLILPFQRLRGPLGILFALTLTAFGGWHMIPMIQVFAGPVVFKRLFSFELPFLLSAALHLWGAFLAGVLVWNSARAWHDKTMSFHERTLLLWPAAFAAVFIFFRHTSSLRYYSLPALLSLLALAASLPRLARRDLRGVYGCALAAALTTQLFLLREIASPADRQPLKFRVGWRKENSKDFARKEGLFAAFDASRACHIGHPERSFTAIPLFFHRAEKPADCDPALTFDADQCPECPSAPFYRWTVDPAAK